MIYLTLLRYMKISNIRAEEGKSSIESPHREGEEGKNRKRIGNGKKR